MSDARCRIAFVEARYHSFYGAQRSLFTLVTNLSTRFQPLVLLPGEGVVASRYRGAGVEVHILPLQGRANEFGGTVLRLPRVHKAGVVRELLQYNLRVARWLRDSRIDVVYVNDLRALCYVGLAAKLVGLPLIWYVRIESEPSLLSHLGALLATRIILISDSLKQRFTESDRRRFAAKFVTLHTGFELNEGDDSSADGVRRRLGVPEGAPLLGVVGSVTQRKGHELLVQALARLSSYNIEAHLMIVGDTPVGHEAYRERLEDLVDRLALSSRVHWVGYQDRVLPYYRAMDVLVLPSLAEGLPRTVIEGLYVGVPVVASDVGGTKEIITTDELGRVVPPANVEALTHALREVLEDPRMRQHEVRLSRRMYVQKRFGLDSYIRGFEAIVDSLR